MRTVKKTGFKRFIPLIIIILVVVGAVFLCKAIIQRGNPVGRFIQEYVQPVKLYVSDEIPTEAREKLANLKGFQEVMQASESEIKVEYLGQLGLKDTSVVSSRTLLPVGHTYWVRDEIDSDGVLAAPKVYMLESTTADADRRIVEESLGGDISESKFIVAGDKDELLVALEADEEESSIAFISSDMLSPEFKLMKFNGTYFLDSFEGGAVKSYLTVSGSDEQTRERIIAVVRESELETEDNIDKGESPAQQNSGKIDDLDQNLNDKLESSDAETTADTADLSELSKDSVLKLNMTGVTAITRKLAVKVNQSGKNDYPAEKIAEFLKDADLTHTSNEVSFTANCQADPGTMRFCSNDRYLETLKAIGLDIIELTGNHNADYGYEVANRSIDIYDENGWGYFGGGRDADDAAEPLTKVLKGSNVAFLGYNYYDTVLGSGAIATDSHSGANSYSTEKVRGDIAEARANGAEVVIVTFQFTECYSYPSSDVIFPICYKPIAKQEETFKEAIDLGADIVVGTQAHQPQTYEIYKGKSIFYGLGNLFFDQTPWIGTRQGMILTHYIHNGKLIQTKLTPTIYGNELQVKVAEGEDKNLLLRLLQQARD